MNSYFRSVKFRLTVWYALVLTIFLSVFAGFMYSELSRMLYRDADKKLQTESLALVESLGGYLGGVDLSAQLAAEARPLKNPFWVSPEVRLKLGKTIQDWENGSRRFSQSALKVRFIHLDHSVLVSNLTGWENQIIFPSYERDSVFMETGESFQTIHFRKKPIRIYYYLVRHKSRPLFVVQALLPIEEVEKTLSRLALIILISIPIAVVAACLAGWVLAKRSFSPVDLMIREARQITAAYLKGRLPRTSTGDELDRLAETLNEMMDRIEASTRAIQDFSSDISHELKTPLAIIRGEIDLAFRKSRSSADLKETLRVIEEEVKELILLVDDLMLLLRSDAKQIKYEIADVFLGELLSQIIQRFQERAQGKNITLSLHASSDLAVKGDAVYLKRLFSNLVDNAIKFTSDFGQVTIELKSAENGVSVEIKDNGIGMEPAVIAKVFSRFYRADQARAFEGAGLGLNIAQAIANSHGAKIEIASKPTQGTTVRIIFPSAS